MSNRSVKKRIKITKKGVKRRSQGLGHNRSKWSSGRRSRKLGGKDFGVKMKRIKQLVNW